MHTDAYFDPAELGEIMQSVPAETEQLVRTTLGEVTAELNAGKVPSHGSPHARLLELADTLDTIGHQLDEARGSRPCPFAELADDIRHAA